MSESLQQDRSETRAGVLAGFGAYFWWGLVPLYFKRLHDVDPLVVISHRVLWSVVLLVGLVSLQGTWGEVRRVFGTPKTFLTMCLTGVLVATNWGIFIYAVEQGRVLEASLGYFLTPLVHMLLGFLFLHERVRPVQRVAIGIAFASLVYLAARTGLAHVPWIPVGLAASFGFYALLRKVAPVSPTVGLFAETTILLPLAIAWLVLQTPELMGGPGTAAVMEHKWLFLAGVITTVPLLLFTYATKRLRLVTIGFLQYVGPTCQFLLAVAAFGEQLTYAHRVTFAMIWFALALYTLDSWRATQAARPVAVAVPEVEPVTSRA